MDGAAQTSPTELYQSILSFKGSADQSAQAGPGAERAGDMTDAQQSLLIALELRRDGLQKISDDIKNALGDEGDNADKAINGIAGQMRAFDASDVLYNARVQPFMSRALSDAGHRREHHLVAVPARDLLGRAGVRRLQARHAAVETGSDAGTTPGRQEAADRAGPARHRAQRHQLRRRDALADRLQPAHVRQGPALHRRLHQPGRQRRVRHQGDAQDHARQRVGLADHPQQDRAAGRQGREGDRRRCRSTANRRSARW